MAASSNISDFQDIYFDKAESFLVLRWVVESACSLKI